jgi:hypothetical protein
MKTDGHAKLGFTEFSKCGRFAYKLKSMRHSSSRTGNCDVCDKWCSEVFHQSQQIQITPDRWIYNGSCSFGHRECLIELRERIEHER